MNPCRRVRESAAWVVERAQHVQIGDASVIERAAELIMREAPTRVDWDADDLHYTLDAAEGGPRTAQCVFVMDALNFCFWPSTSGMEYEHLARGLKTSLERDPHALDADRLKTVTAEDISAWLAPHDVPLAEERAARVRELGEALEAEFDGLALNMVKRAGRSAVNLVRLITAHLPGFRDEAVYCGRHIALYKRAQICVSDVWAAYGRPGPGAAEPLQPLAFEDLSELTMFADYRVPQPLRHMGVLQYSAPLAARVDAHEELLPGSPEEVEIRASTIVAVERMREALQARGRELLSIELDWWLWQTGESRKDELPAHHRTLTMFY